MSALPADPFAPVVTDEAPANPVVANTLTQEEEVFDVGLRPQKLQEFIGQQPLKDNLSILIEAARRREEPMDHVLFYGNPGLGKTTLAHIIANEAEVNIKVTSGPSLTRVGDLAAILTNLKRGDILFIDEIHRMSKAIEEVLYPAMEDYVLDLIVGKGPSARTIRLSLEPFTIIGATTRASLLSSPLRDRFGATYHLEFYNEVDMRQIIDRSAQLLDVTIDADALNSIAGRARRTPRIANRLLRRVRDYAQVKHDGHISPTIAEAAMDALAVDPHGLNSVDRLILTTIINTFQGGPVGLKTLAAASAEDEQTIEEMYEPYLLQLGLLNRTSRGRIATSRAYQLLGIQQPPTA
ncbi:Holliday junction branch migration DNA helicase RuvB [Candidatus Uhrbacteria bacterium CG10_big_fil_rev_8_21_14_0_10_50_16]|uniref:Holliday junction branch migration complex subunit RuvB n=1 Tax=Candidatus Uhrbacteria bacterium CG10_big_fil_rev_8_21_14_0_10_50_16 TaxID=1975039 RepID=A0A2H0RNB0_9BACT|nr:MAG: Holliday junction branch migration DNA helicase RuvB [Candidatus Uhrbacteria bacterium CG10_big_fil_rev_8_21_14_0_10_50_16]